MPEKSIAIVIPTFQRPNDLLVAARSVFTQTMLEKTDCTLVIIDNDPAASAKDAVEALKADCPANLTLITEHEPRAGVASSRNRAISLINSDLIAFMDDDQSAVSDTWLENLYDLYKDIEAGVIFGPVITALPKSVVKHTDYLSAFFSREAEAKRGFIKHYYGLGNCLVDVAQLPPERPLFDERTNAGGGEDVDLFERMQARGGTFGWAPEAAVYERVPKRRATLRYAYRRAFSFGQGPSGIAVDEKAYHKLSFWMIVGAAQFSIHGILATLCYILRLEARVTHADKAIRGLGKTLFWIKDDLYGAPALRDPSLIHEDEITLSPRG